MNTKQLISLTLLATALTLNGATPKEYTHTSKQKANSLSSKLASILYKRGIEKEKALEISKSFISDQEELFTLMLHNLLANSSLNQEKILDQLSTMALRKKPLDLTSYASIIQLVQRVNDGFLDDKELLAFEKIASKNRTLKKVFTKI